jgi:DNA-binding ferritin-like protein (Dps family)
MELSAKSQEFLENLRLYLFSSGKKTEEIEEVIEELRDHLQEAEQAGKNVGHIIGQSPKHYMEKLSQEMRTDIKGWTKMIPIFIIGVFAYFLLGDALHGTIHYSLYDLIGFPFICLLLLKVYLVTFKLLAKGKSSILREFVVFYGVGLLSVSLFVGLLLMDKKFGTPLFEWDSMMARILVGGFAAFIFIGMAVWSKSWISIIIPTILYLPETVIQFLPVNDKTELLLSSMLMFFGFIILFGYQFIMNKKGNKNRKVL